VTSPEFLALFPEFAALAAEVGGADLISGALARSARRVSDSWGARRDDVIGLTTAHMLALGPWGRNARLSTPQGTTTYGAELAEMKKGHAYGRTRVVVDPEI
jgi:hypothetical protein